VVPRDCGIETASWIRLADRTNHGPERRTLGSLAVGATPPPAAPATTARTQPRWPAGRTNPPPGAPPTTRADGGIRPVAERARLTLAVRAAQSGLVMTRATINAFPIAGAASKRPGRGVGAHTPHFSGADFRVDYVDYVEYGQPIGRALPVGRGAAPRLMLAFDRRRAARSPSEFLAGAHTSHTPDVQSMQSMGRPSAGACDRSGRGDRSGCRRARARRAEPAELSSEDGNSVHGPQGTHDLGEEGDHVGRAVQPDSPAPSGWTARPTPWPA
jgi:hypothetical protein